MATPTPIQIQQFLNFYDRYLSFKDSVTMHATNNQDVIASLRQDPLFTTILTPSQQADVLSWSNTLNPIAPLPSKASS